MTSDHTVDADDDELDRLRQLARAAEQGLEFGDRTQDADDATLRRIQQLAVDAAKPSAVWDPPNAGRRLPQRVDLGPAVVVGDVPPPAAPTMTDCWVPPSRSVLPERERPEVPDVSRPWRWATVVLAVVVLALVAAWLLVGRSGGEPIDPDSTEVPNSTAPAGVPVTGGQGGMGG